MSKMRLDQLLVKKGLVSSRSQAESWIRLKKVTVNGSIESKPGQFVAEDADIKLNIKEQYVSRAALKLESVASLLGVKFKERTVMDVGSSTGGFTEFALRQGAKKVIAVDVGTDQMHLNLRSDERIELHEKTDIRNFTTEQKIDIVVIDVSFISLRDILPSVIDIAPGATVLAMVKPQFEAGREQINKGVIKNDAVRRKILHDFESWAKSFFIITSKRDSDVAGSKGNRERFYLLKIL